MDLADLEFLKLISGGGSGKVYLVRDCVEGQYLALKVMPKKRELNTVNNILNERHIQSMLSLEDDRYFVPLVASWHDEVNYYIATVCPLPVLLVLDNNTWHWDRNTSPVAILPCSSQRTRFSQKNEQDSIPAKL